MRIATMTDGRIEKRLAPRYKVLKAAAIAFGGNGVD
jgi:hypothetical protein